MSRFPVLIRSISPSGEPRFSLGDPLVDSYLEFVGGRCRPTTLRAVAFDLKTFFGVVAKAPSDVEAADVFDFLAHQRGDRTVVRISDGESGLSARTIARRISSISGLYAYLVARGDVGANPVPRGLPTRRRGGRRHLAPLVRVPKTLPSILSPDEVDALVGSLRKHRDRAMVFAMLLGGLRRCEVLGLRLSDVQVAERSLFVADGKGGRQRVVPISNPFFTELGHYLRAERPQTDTDRLFVTLKGPTRGQPLGADGVDIVLRSARTRAGLGRATCHQLRHTCLTRLREAGMALEAVQAQAGHASLESTRVYLHLTNDWLAAEYHQAAEAIDAAAAAELVAIQEVAQ
ncbi:MAG TPA: tyrosine-type recombinase/integrase [Acidimicrobiales bacterium]|nr:tyrosine-type recombinase/integrase [Acidimicrobiales bacterium]